MGNYVKVAKTDALEDNKAMLVEAEGKSLALIRCEGNYYAIDNDCTHVGGPLCEGEITAEEVTCPWHAARFNVKTGEAVAGPARSGVGSYAVRVEGDDVEIEL